MSDQIRIDAFLDASSCARLTGELRASSGNAAPVYGGASGGGVEARVRRVTQLEASAELRALIRAALENVRPALEESFATSLGAFDEPQFLRYRPGDYFVAHQDGNTPLTTDDTRHRRVSIVVFLNDGYEGGALTLYGRFPDVMARHAVDARPGTLVAFRSETTHEVTPVTSGERYTIVTWFRAAEA